MAFMDWASLGLSLASGFAARGIEKAQQTVNKAQADAANVIRSASNQEKAALGGLARYMQAENNKRRLRAAGEQFSVGTQNLMRLRDSRVTGDIEQQLQEAEAQGAYAANAAFSGTGGNAVDMIDLTMRLRDSRAQRARDEQAGYLDYDAVQQIAGIIPQTLEGLDTTLFNDGMDRSTNMHFAPPASGGILFDILQSPGFRGVLEDVGKRLTPADQPNTGLGLRATSSYGLKAQSASNFSFDTGRSYALID